jgi:hypothetical protein
MMNQLQRKLYMDIEILRLKRVTTIFQKFIFQILLLNSLFQEEELEAVERKIGQNTMHQHILNTKPLRQLEVQTSNSMITQNQKTT